MFIFRHRNKTLNYDLKINLDGKRLYPSRYVKYLGILIDSHLNWSSSRAIGMLSKIRHFVQSDTLRTIYFGLFSSILMYGSQIWGNHHNIHINRIIKLQGKALRILNFAHYRAPASPILYIRIPKYQNLEIILHLIISSLFMAVLRVFFHTSLITILFIFKIDMIIIHVISSQHHVKLPKSNTLIHRINSITGQSARAWNYFQSKFDNLCYKSRRCCKYVITLFYITSYVTQ